MAITDQIFFANRRSEMERYVEQDAHNNTAYNGVIHSVSPLSKLQGTCEVYIPRLSMYVKADVTAGGYYRGNTVDYRVGDTVIVQFVNGKTERPIVVALAPRHHNEFAILNGEVPTLGVKSENNPPQQPYPTASPESVIPGAVKHNYDVTGQVIPIQLENSSFATNYLPSTAVWSAGGDYSIYPAGTFHVKAAHSQIVVLAPTGSSDAVLAPFSDLQTLEVDPKIATKLLRNPPLDDYVYGGEEITYDPLLPTSQEIFPVQGGQEFLEAAQGESEAIQALEGCITGNLDSVGDLVGSILKAILPIALEELNGVLPDFLQVGVDEEGNVSVGPLKLDAEKGTITLDGEVFNAFIDEGLSRVTEMLPDFLGFNFSGGLLSIGDITVDINTLDFSGGDVSIGGLNLSETESGDIVAKLGDTVLQNLTKIGQSILGKPISELNKSLPEGMQVGVSLGPNGAPVFEVGPLKLDFSNGFDSIADIVTLDMDGLMGLLGGQLESLFGGLMSQLPKPVMMLAQALWTELNIGGLIMGVIQDVIGTVAGEALGAIFGIEAGGKLNKVIGNASYTCGLASLPPLSNNGPVIVSPGSFLDLNKPINDVPGETPIAPPAGKKSE